jgi:hypothetical protein
MAFTWSLQGLERVLGRGGRIRRDQIRRRAVSRSRALVPRLDVLAPVDIRLEPFRLLM